MVLFFVILALVFVLVLVIVSNIVIVPQSKVYVIERLGSYSDTWTAGLHVKIPFIERIAKKVSLKEQVADFPPQPVITRDNVTMQIDTVVFFQVMDAKLYTYGVNQPIAAIESLPPPTLPGEPIDSIVPLDASEELRQVIIDQYGFDQPLYMQYFMWLGNAVRGNFGNSVSDNRLVLSVVSEALHNTLILALGASIFAFLLSILIGVYSSYRPNSIFSWIGTVFGIGGISIPNYCLSLILIGIFSVTLRLLPSTGMYTSGDYTFSSLIQHLILPAIAAGAMTLGIMDADGAQLGLRDAQPELCHYCGRRDSVSRPSCGMCCATAFPRC